MSTRSYWIQALQRLAQTPLAAMAEGKLHQRLPVQCHPDCDPGRIATMRLEICGRLLHGLAPWFACPDLKGAEADLRDRMAGQARIALANGSDPAHPDFWQPGTHNQALVDASFVAGALLRAPSALWDPLDASAKDRILQCFLGLRQHAPWFNNWLLFSATIEAFLAKAGSAWDPMRVDYAIRQHEQWYLGDGLYSDGPEYHQDYYNSFVIQPMLFEVLEVAAHRDSRWADFDTAVRQRLARYAAILERQIGQDGTWPVVGRSICYRTGAFHALSLAAWKGLLPCALPPAQVRCALTAAIQRGLYPDSNYDANGWLHIGLTANQPSLGEPYITTASCYLAAFVFPALGLPPQDPFWSDPDQPWTARAVWSLQQDFPADAALRSRA